MPDNQRGAIDRLIVGLALAGRGQISDALCDQYVADGILAIRATYTLQTSAGDFSTRSDAVTSLGGGANAMHFFMAWSNHALPLLEQSPYGATYASELAMLRPHVERSMDYLVLHGSPDFADKSSELRGDWGSANRSSINATAFALGHRFLQSSSGAAKLDVMWRRAQGWLGNVFVNTNPFVLGGPLFRARDGLFLEKPPNGADGYDTSYDSVGLRFILYILANYPDAVGPLTGLAPDYATFEGAPTGSGHIEFRFDAWRVVANLAVDHAWWSTHAAAPALVQRLLGFFRSKGFTTYANQYTIDGISLSADHSPGLVAMNAVGALALPAGAADDFVLALWNLPIPSGKYRYYDGVLYMMALLHASGQFRVYVP